MSYRDELVRITARDARYAVDAYLFVLEALEYTKQRKWASKGPERRGSRAREETQQHVTGQELCDGARRLALERYGMLARMVLEEWGLRSTEDIGQVVYNMIAMGDLEKTPEDQQSDFDAVFDWEGAFTEGYRILDEAD
jgi:uncharacterized repeat protein (TIGR04138 family)